MYCFLPDAVTPPPRKALLIIPFPKRIPSPSAAHPIQLQSRKNRPTISLKIQPSDTSQSSQTIAASEDSDVDYDLTTMDSDMVYATVFQITSHPEDYVGKTFQIEGIFSSSYADTLDRYFYYCIIKDALACCAQGLEFVLSDSEELSPEDYPAEGTEIIVRGTLEAYTEPGFSVSYGRLVDASYTLVSSEP